MLTPAFSNSIVAPVIKQKSYRVIAITCSLFFLTSVMCMQASTPAFLSDCATAIDIAIPFDSSGIIVAGQGDDLTYCATGDGEDLFLHFLGPADTCLQLMIGFSQSQGVATAVCVSLFALCPEGGGGTSLLSYQDSAINGNFAIPFISIQQDSTYFLVIESDSDSTFFDISFDYMHQGCAESTCVNTENVSLPFSGTYWIGEEAGDNVNACISIYKYDLPEFLPSPGYDVVFEFNAPSDTLLALTVDYLTGCSGSDICFSMYTGCPGSIGAEMIFSNSINSCNLFEIIAPVLTGHTYYLIMEYEPADPATFSITIDYLCAYGDCYVFNGTGAWDDPTRWDVYPGENISQSDFVIIGTGSECSTPLSGIVNQGLVVNRGTLTISNLSDFTIDGGILMNTDSLFLDVLGTMNGCGAMTNTGVLKNYGVVSNAGTFECNGSGILRIENHGTCYNTPTGSISSSSPIPIVNYGYFENNSVMFFSALFNEGMIFNTSNAALSTNITNIDSLLNEGFIGTNKPCVNNGYFTSTTHTSFSSLTNTGTFESDALVSGDVQNSGFLKGSIRSPFNILNTGTLMPGGSVGGDTVSGLFIQSASGKTVLEIEGTAGGGVDMGHDHVVGIDQSILNGIIEIQLSGYAPILGDQFTLVEYDEILDDQAMLVLPLLDSCLAWKVQFQETALQLSVVSSPDSDGDGTQDCEDTCPEDPDKITPGVCGCGIADTDSNADGQSDCLDADVAVLRQSASPAMGPRITGHVADGDSTQAWYLGSLTDTDTSLVLMNRRRDALQFGTANTIHMTLDTAGRLGIGRTPTTNTLEVQGEASKSTPGDWLANSDVRLKKNITFLDPGTTLAQLMQLQGITYEWKDLSDYSRPVGTQIGLTAQNIQSVFPGQVQQDKDGYLMSAYGTLDPIFIESIRALQHKTQTLTKINVQLSKRIKAMEQLMDISKPGAGQ